MFNQDYLSDEELESLRLLREIEESINDASDLHHLVKVIDVSEA